MSSADHGATSGQSSSEPTAGALPDGVGVPPDEGVSGEDIPEAASSVFGTRVDLARAYYELLATDGIEHGLIGPREVPRLWDRHILNCGVVGDLLHADERVVDIGSGAGLPGIPLAIARPDVTVILVEPLQRRVDFLERTVAQLELDVQVVRGRAEEKAVREEAGGADVVTSRAVAPLARLAGWSAPLIRVGGRMLALKGSSARDEITRDEETAARVGVVDLDVTSCGSGLVETPTIVVSGTKVAVAGGGPANREAASKGRSGKAARSRARKG